MFSMVIQAGGESRRMGQDKGLVPFLGQPLVRRVMERVAGLADEVIVTTNHPQDYEFLGVRLAADLFPGRGALGGLYTALASAAHPLVGVVACDMPFASAELFAHARHLLLDGDLDAVIPRTGHGSEPFHAVYRRETCLPAIQAALQADLWRVDAWYPQASIYFLEAEEIERLDPRRLAFQNVNTPEELRQAEELAAGDA